MAIESALRLNMSYFNNAMALWEPLIEKVEKETESGLYEFLPWELNFDLKVDKHREEVPKREPTTKIVISSKDTLEMTCTKTCLDVLQSLGKSFSEAISSDGLIKPECEAPYIVKNCTGMEIEINLSSSSFVLHESVDRSSEHCMVRPGSQAYLQPKTQDESAKNMNTTDLLLNSSERFLYVKICDKKELMLPISRADKRYFPLYRDSNQEPWGIISEVTVEMGATIIKLRGILQVENHFTTSINVHTFSNNEVELIAEIPPNTVYDIPLQIIYAANKDLHFSMNGYKVSVQSISWKENPSDFNLVKTLQCDPVKTYEPLYMNVNIPCVLL
jgi:vacuolar protein sorting-associated protein 13A/C